MRLGWTAVIFSIDLSNPRSKSILLLSAAAVFRYPLKYSGQILDLSLKMVVLLRGFRKTKPTTAV